MKKGAIDSHAIAPFLYTGEVDRNISVSISNRTTPSQIEISGLPVQVVRKSVKNMHLSVRPPDGQVRVTVPWKTPDDVVIFLVSSRLNWIQKHQAVLQAKARLSPCEIVTGETHYLFGQCYQLQVIDRPGRPEVMQRDRTLQLFVPPGTSTEKRAAVLNQWYRDRLKAEIPDLLDFWQPKIDRQVAEWGVKKMKTRWGSCNISQRRIWLNLELAKYPIECLEYVLVHELVHLLERYHNDRFKAYLDQFLPDWPRCHNILNPKPGQ